MIAAQRQAYARCRSRSSRAGSTTSAGQVVAFAATQIRMTRSISSLPVVIAGAVGAEAFSARDTEVATKALVMVTRTASADTLRYMASSSMNAPIRTVHSALFDAKVTIVVVLSNPAADVAALVLERGGKIAESATA